MNQKVLPTAKWQTRLNIFGVGELPVPDPQGVELDIELAQWAIRNQYATICPTRKSTPAQVTATAKEEVTTQEAIADQSETTSVTELISEALIDYLNQAPIEELTKIQGIGEKTAKVIISKRPVSVALLSKILSPSQIEATRQLIDS
jgi:hypothetical protein